MYTHQQKTWSVSKILIGIAVIAALILAYVGYFGDLSLAQVEPGPAMTGPMPTATPGEVPVEGQKEIIGKDLLALLDKIESLNIDTSIFTDPAYLSLEDFSVAILPETPGRNNPFAPFVRRGGSQSATRR